ncbi:NADH dehydrogenase [ubiquinone] 1 beta subcomplex subunit 4 isoform X1 [Gallus gallus]|uniref:NADH dehydrogenase [ubiquinone] 1 beta subcomplex subunit 4 isoform X1 n=1 Tax=Gallus gallus TaxID=9031 RepID=UPI0000E7F9E0|nr:NADH dehydrogenase [ubiquinone] 1 beta subcomplex subunit 4 isoform X1 [Gallus gallus]
MALGPSRTAAEEYRPNRYVSLPAELDPATYDTSLEKRRAEAERLAIRARLKRQYLLQLNNPKPPAVIEDPALLRWDYARTHNVYPTFRPTPKTSFLGAVFAIGPILFWIAAFKTERDYKEKLIREELLLKGYCKRCYKIQLWVIAREEASMHGECDTQGKK